MKLNRSTIFMITNNNFVVDFSTIHGRIDQVKQVLELDQESAGLARYTALDKWTTQLQSLHLSVVNKMA